MKNLKPCKKSFQVEHKASLPYCWYDTYRGKIVLRLAASEDPESITVIYGDPYDWEKSGGGAYRWRFTEAEMFRALSGTCRVVWKAEIGLPVRRRLKYGFHIKTKIGEFYFSENGVEPYRAEAVNLPHNHFFFPFVHEVDAPSVPAWARDRVWYQIFPDRFCRGASSISPPGLEDWETGTPGQGSFFGGDIAGIKEKLPWLEALGITGIYLTPVFKSPSNHKYDTADYFSVDEHFGTLGELKSLIAGAHSRGIRLMLDGVFNHAGKEHPFEGGDLDFDAVMNYPLGLAVSDYFLERKTDASRFTERIFSALGRLSDLHNSAAFNLLDSHDTQRALNRAKGDKQALRNAFTMLFLLPGSPCLYYGTETGMTGGEEPDCRRPMIWDETRQDKDLLDFFKNLINLKKTYYTIINQGVIEYKNHENFRRWKFSGGDESLYAVYTEDRSAKLPEMPGAEVFSTGPVKNGELFPYTLAVYYKRHL